MISVALKDGDNQKLLNEWAWLPIEAFYKIETLPVQTEAWKWNYMYLILSFLKVRIMYEDFIKGTKDNSENSTYTGFQKYFETKIGKKW